MYTYQLEEINTAKKKMDRGFVVHDYKDHSKYMMRDFIESQLLDGCATNTTKKDVGPRGGVAIPFPTKLHMILSKAEEADFAHVISWQPHGRCFMIHDQREFVKNVMTAYFNQTKLTSFQRQLNLYGFRRLTSGKDRGGYYHELFLKHKLFLCDRIVRIRIKGTGVKGKANPDTEPNFYSMPAIMPEPDLKGKCIGSMNELEHYVANDSNAKEIISKSTDTNDNFSSPKSTLKNLTPAIVSPDRRPIEGNFFPDTDATILSTNIDIPNPCARHGYLRPKASDDASKPQGLPPCIPFGVDSFASSSSKRSTSFHEPHEGVAEPQLSLLDNSEASPRRSSLLSIPDLTSTLDINEESAYDMSLRNSIISRFSAISLVGSMTFPTNPLENHQDKFSSRKTTYPDWELLNELNDTMFGPEFTLLH